MLDVCARVFISFIHLRSGNQATIEVLLFPPAFMAT
jgi:hypothetical protein